MRQKRILVICPYPQGVAAGQRLKYEQYFENWRASGYVVIVSSFMDMSMWGIVYTRRNYALKVLGTLRGYFRRMSDLFLLGRVDIVYVFMWVTPFGTSLFERLFRLLSRRLIFDLEDNLTVERPNTVNPFAKLMKGKDKTRYLIKTADHVITSSSFLNDSCMRLNRKKACTYISSSVNTDRFLPVNVYRNEKKIVIGWTGTFSSKSYLNLLKDVFYELNKRCEFRLRIIGNFEYELPGIDLEVVQWTRDREIQDLQEVDIGIYPLIQEEWALGKSGLKAIQYMACGLPTVATNYGMTPFLIAHMENGLLVQTDAEWVDALELLVKNQDLRRSLGEAARKSVLKYYSINIIKLAYLSILDKLLEVKS